jgi:hypothetical protein
MGDPLPADLGEKSTSRTKKRLVIAVGAVLVAAVTVFGVIQLRGSGDAAAPPATTDPPPPELTASDVANQFLDAFARGDAAAAGRLTDNEPAATAQLAEVRRTLTPVSVTVDPSALVQPAADATVADEPFAVTWTFSSQRTWQYNSGLHLVKNDAGWRVNWQPALVHPRLAAGQTLVMHEGVGQPAVVDRDGTPLVNWATDQTTAADPAVAPRLTGALGRHATELGTAAGWYVSLADGKGAELEVVYGTKALPLVTTLSVPVQKAAQAAADSQQLPTLLVAIQPSSGDILAVAQNAAAGTELTALNGLFPPGSTFKIATATALIEAGIADTGTVLPCPGQALIGQRTIKNAGGFDLGDVPLHTAFAESCNTTFATQAGNLAPQALGDAAAQLGLDADFAIPAIPTEAGGVPLPANPAQQVENSIGQGTVQTSCFGLSLMTATVSAGHAVTPKLWRDEQTAVSKGYTAPPANVIRSLRTMMREVVTSGTAKGLAGYGNVFGKTGTAEIGNDAAHGWFAGYRDDIAFATLVQNGNSSSVAVDVTGKFLGALG